MINLIFILFGVFLRINNINNDFYFTGELGKELLYSKYLVEENIFPTVGMATSHEWLYYGPIYYWVLTPLLKLFNFNPFVLFWLAIFVSVLGLIINYKLITKIANKNVAIYSSILMSLSPIFIWQTRLSKLHVFFFLLIPILIYLLKLVWDLPAGSQVKRNSVFLLGITFGVFFSFHFSQIPLIFVILTVLLIKKYKLIDYFVLLLGILIPNFGIVIKDLKILLWLPYRSLGLSEETSNMTLYNFNHFLGMQFFWDEKYWILGSVMSIIILITFCKKFIFTINKKFFNYYLFFSTLIVFVGLVLHKNPPVHYFLPVFANIFYMLSILMDKYLKKWHVFLIFLVFSIYSYLDYKMPTGFDYISYKNQINISQKIVDENKNIPIKINRIGPYDYFPDKYSQNYRFLIWYLGGNLDDINGKEVIINDNENINLK